MNRLRKYVEEMAGRKTNRGAYVMDLAALPDPLPGSAWQEDTLFRAGDAILRDPRRPSGGVWEGWLVTPTLFPNMGDLA